MNGELAYWNYGLLFAMLSVLMGTVGVMSARHSDDRRLMIGLFLQGVLLTFVVGSVHFRGSVELRLGGLAVIGLMIVQSFGGLKSVQRSKSQVQDESA